MTLKNLSAFDISTPQPETVKVPARKTSKTYSFIYHKLKFVKGSLPVTSAHLGSHPRSCSETRFASHKFNCVKREID